MSELTKDLSADIGNQYLGSWDGSSWRVQDGPKPPRWATPHTDTPLVRFSMEETAALQTFPEGYVLGPPPAITGLGNALPPIIMQQLLEADPQRRDACPFQACLKFFLDKQP